MPAVMIAEAASDDPQDPDAQQMKLARLALTKFVRLRAKETSAALGVSWVPSDAAPETYQQLRSSLAQSLRTGLPLPVSTVHASRTILLTQDDAAAFQFWHTVHHVQLGLSFAVEDELELATWHLEQAERAGVHSGSLGHRLLEAHLIAPLILHATSGLEPHDPKAFVLNCVRRGLAGAILGELRRLPQAISHDGKTVGERRTRNPSAHPFGES